MKCCDNMDSETKKAIIMEHYTNPLNRDTIDDPNYIKINSNSETCIDNLDIYVLFNKDKIEDIHFNGEACAISTSAASIMTRLFKDKNKKKKKSLINEYNDMIETGKEYEDLEEALAYSDIYKQANRKGCATIPLIGLEKAINEYEKRRNRK